MDYSKISTSELLAYSTILENIIHTCVSITNEADRAVVENIVKLEDFGNLGGEVRQSHELAKEKYEDIQKELDDRIKRDLRMPMAIRKVQSIIVKFEGIIHQKNMERAQSLEGMEEDALRIAGETKDVIPLNTKSDDNNQNEENNG